MKVAPEVHKRLAELLELGATLTADFNGRMVTRPLAVALLIDGPPDFEGLVYALLNAVAQNDVHVVDADSAELHGPYVYLYDRVGRLVGSVAEMEPDERVEFDWDTWVEYSSDPEQKAGFWRLLRPYQEWGPDNVDRE